MKLNIEQLKEAHFQIDQFVRDPKLYSAALKRSRKKAMGLCQARALLKSAMELLGDDDFFDIVAMLEEGKPLAPDEQCDLCRIGNKEMSEIMRKEGRVAKQWAVVIDALMGSIPVLKQ